MLAKILSKLLRPFGCEILVNDILDYPIFFKEYDIRKVTLPELMTRSDVVSIHVPLNINTRGILDLKNAFINEEVSHID